MCRPRRERPGYIYDVLCTQDVPIFFSSPIPPPASPDTLPFKSVRFRSGLLRSELDLDCRFPNSNSIRPDYHTVLCVWLKELGGDHLHRRSPHDGLHNGEDFDLQVATTTTTSYSYDGFGRLHGLPASVSQSVGREDLVVSPERSSERKNRKTDFTETAEQGWIATLAGLMQVLDAFLFIIPEAVRHLLGRSNLSEMARVGCGLSHDLNALAISDLFIDKDLTCATFVSHRNLSVLFLLIGSTALLAVVCAYIMVLSAFVFSSGRSGPGLGFTAVYPRWSAVIDVAVCAFSAAGGVVFFLPFVYYGLAEDWSLSLGPLQDVPRRILKREHLDLHWLQSVCRKEVFHLENASE